MSAIYVKIEGITGESKDSKHKGWVDVLDFSYRVSQSTSVFTGGGGGVGKADFAPLAFTHFYDRASPVLFGFCAAGKHIPKVLISACKAGGKQEEFLRITLSDVVLTHVEPGGTSGSMPAESVGMAYSKIEAEAREQNADGSMGAAVAAGWDVKENRLV
jgi:type VI secretion system secreted protein Hcp